MKYWLWMLVLWSCSSLAVETKDLNCQGRLTLINGRGEIAKTAHVKLKPSPQDPLFLQGRIEDLRFHVDTYYLSEAGVGLMVSHKIEPTIHLSVVGFKEIPNTKVRIASAKEIKALDDGGQRVAETHCTYTED